MTGPVRLHVTRHPGDDPVLLVHGFATTGALTWQSTGWVDALAAGGRGALVPDLRGHGASDAPHDPAAYSPALLAADLLAALDQEGLGAVDVIGYSMGSWASLALAGLVPEIAPGRVRRLVVGGIGTVEQFAHWGVAAVQAAIRDGVDVPDPGFALGPLLASLRRAPGIDTEALAACVEGMAQHPLPLGPVGIPTLLVAGDVDPVAEDAGDAARLLGAELVRIPRRDHITTLSARAFKQAALPFLGIPASL
ncbi:alpha/beta hydrolase [Leifsonia sp. LS1]|uniref:alpha/beta fold hydrolase n=1 Tax=Leifsonia sp. LS1 TaxID=2828483 RepID=UPI001CFE9BE1|nr:alpha/beta fold hydrolase [Leifsonia sp. LS1]GIT80964.1 alpha/beta hydrolase [Leifsonia sp. LS1]